MSKKAILNRLIEPLERIDEVIWEQLKSELEPISDAYLRKLLRATGRPLSPWVEGVNTASLNDAERTLRALGEAYEIAVDRKRIRAVVLESKQHVRWRMQRPDPPPEKQEILLWLSTWLENPLLFSDWIVLRRRGAAGKL